MKGFIRFRYRSGQLGLLLLLVSGISKAQDPHFSQYTFAPVWLNPALVAGKSDLQLSMNYRTQWASITDPFISPQATLIYPLLKRDQQRIGGLSLAIINDRGGANGTLVMTGISGTYAHNLQLRRDQYLSFGVSGGYRQHQLSSEGLTTESQFVNGSFDPGIDIGEDIANDQFNRPDLSAGINWDLEKQAILAGAGIALHHLIREEVAYISMPVATPFRATLHGHFAVTKNNLEFEPRALLMLQGGMTSVNVGHLLRYRFPAAGNSLLKNGALGLGLNYRWQDAFIVSLQVEHPNFVIGFSYDFSASGLSAPTTGRGATEIALVLRKPLTRRQKPKPEPTIIPSRVAKPAETPDSIPAIPDEPEETVIMLTGTVKDAETGAALDAQITISGKGSTSTVTSDASTGKYQIRVYPGITYQMDVVKDNYLFHTVPISIPYYGSSVDLEHPVELTRIAVGVKAIIPTIRFRTNEAILLEESFAVLDKLVTFLNSYPALKVEISGHTDNKGKRSHNMDLSEKRAAAVADYLVEKGIEKERLSLKGYGPDQPVATNRTEEGRQQNRRVEMRILDDQ